MTLNLTQKISSKPPLNSSLSLKAAPRGIAPRPLPHLSPSPRSPASLHFCLDVLLSFLATRKGLGPGSGAQHHSVHAVSVIIIVAVVGGLGLCEGLRLAGAGAADEAGRSSTERSLWPEMGPGPPGGGAESGSVALFCSLAGWTSG